MQKGLDRSGERFYNLSRCFHDGSGLMELREKHRVGENRQTTNNLKIKGKTLYEQHR
jgi:hypothetical protein